MAVGKCSNEFCSTPLEVADIELARIIEKSPQFLALKYHCKECGHKSNIVASIKDWEAAKEAAKPPKVRKVDMRPHRLELDGIKGPADLIAFWKAEKNPPILEDRIKEMEDCCDECRKRLHG